MSLYAAVWVYFAGLALAVAIVAALAVSRRTRQTGGRPAQPQIKWRCPICAYVFIEFEPQRYMSCPRCDTLLDAEHDASGDGPTAAES